VCLLLSVSLLSARLLSASLMFPQLEILQGTAFRDRHCGNLDSLIHFLKHGTIDASLLFQSLTYVIVEHLLDQQFQILCFWRETPIHCLLHDIRQILSW
jgi:hypothetical protein